jgi:hypothetical protein
MFSGCFIPLPASTWGREGRRQETRNLDREHNIDTAQYGRNLPPGDTLKNSLLLAVGMTFSLSAFAQTNSQTLTVVEPMAQTPTFRVTVVSRSVRAVNYQHRTGLRGDRSDAIG